MIRSPSGSPVVLAGEVVVELADPLVPVDRAGDLGERVRQRDQRPLRRARAGGHVVGMQVGRVDVRVVAAVAGDLHPRVTRWAMRAPFG